MKQQTPEGALLRLALDWLAAKRIFSLRMNAGVLRNPAGRPVQFGVPGQADILAFPRDAMAIVPTWIECKAPGGKQTELQKSFQAKVEAEGHRYFVVRELSELEAAFSDC